MNNISSFYIYFIKKKESLCLFAQKSLEQLSTSRNWEATVRIWRHHRIGMFCRSGVQTWRITYFISNAVMCLDAVLIHNQWFNAFCQLDRQRKITKVLPQVAEWALLELSSWHYFSFVFRLPGFWYMSSDTVLGQAWTVFQIQMLEISKR